MFWKNTVSQKNFLPWGSLLCLLAAIGLFMGIKYKLQSISQIPRSSQQNCVFCNIDPEKFVLEKESLFVIHDIAPRAKTHLLIIPKNHIRNMKNVSPVEDALFWKELLVTIQELSTRLKNEQSFALENHNEKRGKQTVFHLHWHFLSADTLD
jgi:histidine triad (HIT) family protein